MKHKARRFDLSPDNFLAGIGTKLKADELGLYWLICLRIYSAGGPAVYDEQDFATTLNRTDIRVIRRASSRLQHLGKITVSGGYVMANGCASAIEQANKRIASAVENGAKGGRPTKENKDLAKPGGFGAEKLTTTTTTTTNSSSAADTSSELNQLGKILGLPENDYLKHAANMRVLMDLKRDGCNFQDHILPAAQQAAKSRKAISSLNYIAPRAKELRDAQKTVSELPTPFEDTDVRGWNDRLSLLAAQGRWSKRWGPKPNETGCRVPAPILDAHKSKSNGVLNGSE